MRRVAPMHAPSNTFWLALQKGRTETVRSSKGSSVFLRYTIPNPAASATPATASSVFPDHASHATAATAIRKIKPTGAKAKFDRRSPASKASGRIRPAVGRSMSNDAQAPNHHAMNAAHVEAPAIKEFLARALSSATASTIASAGISGSTYAGSLLRAAVKKIT